jgi:hypothetical protein
MMSTYFFPMHPRGPSENGRLASLWSEAYAGSNHLSGMNSSGFLKFAGLCLQDGGTKSVHIHHIEFVPRVYVLGTPRAH